MMTRGVSEVGVKAFIKKANRDPELRGPEISRYGSFIWKGWKVATSDGKDGGLARTKLPEGNGWCSKSLLLESTRNAFRSFAFQGSGSAEVNGGNIGSVGQRQELIRSLHRM